MTRAAVTGAFGFSGRHIATRLLARGDEVVNLTNHPDRRDPFDGNVTLARLAFEDPDALVAALDGVDTLYSTYWIRLPGRGITHADAVRNLTALFGAARRAGVRRIVHLSVANADAGSRLSYYRGKGEAEAALAASGLSHAILRPAALVGDEPILVNSIAWLLRRLPVFAIPGDGHYPIAPIHVEDLADLALEAAVLGEDVTWDAVGPETFTFAEFVAAVRAAVGSRSLLVHVPPRLALLGAQLLSLPLRDTLMTPDELHALTDGLLGSSQPPRGRRLVSAWLRDNGRWLGRSYLPATARGVDPG